MIDEKLAELSASNAVLVSQSKATKSQLSYLDEKLESERIIHRQVETRFCETESVHKIVRSELDGLHKETKDLRMKLKAEKDRHKV